MVPLEHVLAVALLINPPGESTESRPPPCSLETVRQLALHWELLDVRETTQLLASTDTFATDLETLRQRYRELETAPPVSDALRFPCRETVCELLAFNRTFQQHLQARRKAMGAIPSELDVTLDEVEQLYRIWELVRDACNECNFVPVRRRALLTLRDTLGAADYYQGKLPPHVPIWRFARRD